MTTSLSDEDDRPIRSLDDLCGVFHAAEKPPSAFRIGAEAEKFAVDSRTGAPLGYNGPHSVVRVFSALERSGWIPERELEGGPVIALRRGDSSITLEPGCQLELSGAALPDVHAVHAEFEEHLGELAPISEELGLVWLGVGFHPMARQSDLGWVPKQRYPVMKDYLPRRGSGAHDMMRRTATVQANFDYSNEADALRKLRVALQLSPLIHAMTANSPFYERRLAGKKSVRGEVWLNMDPERSGLIPSLWRKANPSYRDYVEWALDAGMFLFKRGARVFVNAGQKFRDFMAHGYQGERAKVADFKLHLNTLFPEARLKNTLEVRGCDSLPSELAMAVPALFTGILYDARALDQAEALTSPFAYETVEAARPELIRLGLGAKIGAVPARSLAERVLEIALGGLERRARRDEQGRDERRYLDALVMLNSAGRSPADTLSAGLEGTGPFSTAELIRRTLIRAIPELLLRPYAEREQ
jgi:glutamate--cysteine ligase